jgi:hypothetical protein
MGLISARGWFINRQAAKPPSSAKERQAIFVSFFTLIAIAPTWWSRLG